MFKAVALDVYQSELRRFSVKTCIPPPHTINYLSSDILTDVSYLQLSSVILSYSLTISEADHNGVCLSLIAHLFGYLSY